MAADRLSRCDWRREPAVVPALLTAARTDPAPTVRAISLRSLERLGANIPPVIQAVEGCQKDGDLRVRQAATSALHALGGR